MRLHFVTVSNKPKFELEILKKSCSENGITVNVLGLNQPDIKIGHGVGFGWKLILLRNFLDTLDENDIFVFVDAFDVVVVANENEIINKFLSFDTKILFSAEKFC